MKACNLWHVTKSLMSIKTPPKLAIPLTEHVGRPFSICCFCWWDAKCLYRYSHRKGRKRNYRNHALKRTIWRDDKKGEVILYIYEITSETDYKFCSFTVWQNDIWYKWCLYCPSFSANSVFLLPLNSQFSTE